MDDFDVLLCNALQDYIVVGWFFEIDQIDYIVFLQWIYYPVRESDFAKFALKSFPAVSLDPGRIALLEGALGVKPLAQALNMDKFHGAVAFARCNQRIRCFIFFLTEADATDWNSTLLSLLKNYLLLLLLLKLEGVLENSLLKL